MFLNLPIPLALQAISPQHNVPSVSQNTSIVNKDRHTSKGTDGALNDRSAICHRGRIHNSGAARCKMQRRHSHIQAGTTERSKRTFRYLIDDLLCSLCIEVIYYHVCTARSKQQ
jgi:hypothetical protein